MTVCIAAIAKQARAIVTVIDTKLANESYSHDFGSMKMRTLVNRWSLMYAGVPDLYEKLQRHMNAWLEKHGRPKGIDSMITAAENAYAKELERFVNREILSPFSLTLTQFKRTGLQQLGDAQFNDFIERIRIASHARWDDQNRRIDLILTGFDDFGDPHIVSVSPTGDCIEHYDPGFCVIGSGDTLARAYLQSHDDFHRSQRLGEVCYHMQAAKFASEGSPYVGGKQTITTVFHFDGRLSVNYGADESRRHYDAERARTIPEDIVKSIESSLGGGWVYPV